MTDARITLDAAALKARIATLEAELAAANELADGYRLAVDDSDHRGMGWMDRANALRDSLENVLHNATCACYEDGEPGHCPRCAVAYQEARTLLAQTPAASLAAAKDSLRSHDAEVLERAAKHHDECAIECRNDADRETFAESVRDFISQAQVHERSAAHFRALAAQAATHSVPDGTSEVKP